MKNQKSKIILSLFVFIYTILGFFILPIIIKDQLEKNVNELIIHTASVEKVEFNPFTLKIKIHNLKINDENKTLISFKELNVDFSLLKSIHESHISFKSINLIEPFVNIIQNEDGSINLSSLLKPVKKDEELILDEKDNKKSTISFKITKTQINNANFKFTQIFKEKASTIDINRFNYTFYELGTYKNSLASHSLNAFINKNTKLYIDGGLNLIPFKMYGKIKLENLKAEEFTSFTKDLLKFKISNSTLNMNLGYKVDLEKELKLSIDNANIKLDNFKIMQENKDVLGIKTFGINNLNLEYPKQNINIDNIMISSFFANIQKNSDETLNLNKLVKISIKEDTEENKNENNDKSKKWNISLNNISLDKSNISFNDLSTDSKAIAKNININANKITLIEDEINIKDINLNKPELSYQDKSKKLNTKNINIKLEDIKSKGKDFSIRSVILKEKEISLNDISNKSKIKAKNLNIIVDKISSKSGQIELEKLSIKEPYISIINDLAKNKIIAKNINLNVYGITNKENYLKVLKSDLNKPNISITLYKKINNKNIVKTEKLKQEEKKTPFDLNIGPFKIKNANMVFEDKNLPISFQTNISKLNGSFSELISKSAKPTKLKLEGKIDKYGYTRITGLVDHKDIKNLTDVNLIFKNIAIKNFTPYSGKFVGRELAGGKLNINLNYNISKSNLDAQNSLIITDIKLGKEVISPDAMSLPLGLGIALLEDSNGVIDLNIPISGNVDDPKFSIGPIVWKAFTNLIIKAVSSPFTFLASLLGVDEDEIKSVEFIYGEHNLLDSEKETLDKIALAFTKRPNLALKVASSYNVTLDKKALQFIKFDSLINEDIKKIKKDNKYLVALENRYTNSKIKESLKEIQAKYTITEKGKNILDKDAYGKYLKKVLSSKIEISTKQLETLANNRVLSITQYLDKKHAIKENRLIINKDIKILDQNDAQYVQFELGIDVKKK